MPDWNQNPSLRTPVTPYGRTPKIFTPSRIPSLLTAPQIATQQTGIDLRSKFDNFMESFGQMVLVQKMNLKIHCTHCWNEISGESDPACPYCLGRGYLSVLERHLSRRESSDNEHKQQVLVQSSPGAEVVDSTFWYFSWDTNIAVEDMVYEVTWKDQAKLYPKNLLTGYRVAFSDPFRGSGGRIEYWRAACEARPIDRDIVSKNLSRLAPILETSNTAESTQRYALIGAS